MTKLHEILAVERGQKQTLNRQQTDVYHKLQNATPLSGIVRIYRPKDDDGDRLPEERTDVQVRVHEEIETLADVWNRMWDIAATRDWGNTNAVADVIVDGEVLIEGAPSTYLLWLEKAMSDVLTVIGKLPTLDPSETWEFNGDIDAYATAPRETHRTQKIPRVLEKAPATDKHPAQTEVYHADEVVGYWEQTKQSGATRATVVREMRDRAEKVRDAVRVALTQANQTEVDNKRVAKTVLDFVLAPIRQEVRA